MNLCNEKTIEFRFLRGTLKWETFFISLNLLKNIVENSRKSSHVITLEYLIFNGLDDDFKKYEAAQLDAMEKIDFEAKIDLGEADKKTVESYHAFADRVKQQYGMKVIFK